MPAYAPLPPSLLQRYTEYKESQAEVIRWLISACEGISLNPFAVGTGDSRCREHRRSW